jgi:hypothetical protein
MCFIGVQTPSWGPIWAWTEWVKLRGQVEPGRERAGATMLADDSA